MNEIQALILGVLQGLTEFLPVSSSGHLEIANVILGVHPANNLYFAIVVHVATVLSTIIVFRKDIAKLLAGLFAFEWNDSTKYVSKLLFSSLPILISGFLFMEQIEEVFTGNLILVGSMLLVTASLLTFAHFASKNHSPVTWKKAFLIGVAQLLAVMPGISRSGATIAAGLLLGVKKEEVARFSFLMVLIPILGAAVLNLLTGDLSKESTIEPVPLLIGFLAAFISGLFACSLMIKVIKKGKLIYFSLYCLVIGLIVIFAA